VAVEGAAAAVLHDAADRVVPAGAEGEALAGERGFKELAVSTVAVAAVDDRDGVSEGEEAQEQNEREEAEDGRLHYGW